MAKLELDVDSSGQHVQEAAKQRVCAAAEICFEKYGPQRTSMADIAEEAGISRRTLYRLFDDRSALVEYILKSRMYIMRDNCRAQLAQPQSFEDAIVEGSIISVAAGKNDRTFNQIVVKDTNHRIEQFLFNGNEEILSGMEETWAPIIDQGREKGLVREDLSNRRIAELLVNVHALLFVRNDLDEDAQRRFLKDFLLHAICVKA